MPEVAQAARRVIDASGAPVNWLELPAGAGALETCGEVLPDKTVEAIEVHRVALKGPITTPIGKGFRSVNVQLRKRLNLYAAVRPVRSLPGVKTRYENVELVVILENTRAVPGPKNVTTGVVQASRCDPNSV